MFLSRLRRLWKYNHVLPPCAPPSRPKPQNILCFFPGSPRSQNILCFFSELYCCFPLAFFPFLSPFFSPAFLLLPSLLPRVGKRCVQSGGKQLRACSRGHRRGCSSIDDFYRKYRVKGGESKRRRGRGGTGVTSEKGEKEPKRCYYRQETVSKARRRRKKIGKSETLKSGPPPGGRGGSDLTLGT